jgi:predicted glycosyltransferase
MGVNLVAIFPIGHFDKKIYCVLDKIRNQEYTTIQDYYKSTIFYGFPELSNLRLQWYHQNKLNHQYKFISKKLNLTIYTQKAFMLPYIEKHT